MIPTDDTIEMMTAMRIFKILENSSGSFIELWML